MLRLWAGIALAAVTMFGLFQTVRADNLPANFVWCDCICGNYTPLEFTCILTVSNRHVSDYLQNLSQVDQLRIGSEISFRSACEKRKACAAADIIPWRSQIPQMAFKGFVAVKLQANHPFGPLPVGATIELRGSAYEPMWDRLYPAE